MLFFVFKEMLNLFKNRLSLKKGKFGGKRSSMLEIIKTKLAIKTPSHAEKNTTINLIEDGPTCTARHITAIMVGIMKVTNIRA